MPEPTPKEVVQRFNAEVIEGRNFAAFKELMAEDFVNHTAPMGAPTGPEGMWNTFETILHPAISDLRVVIEDQISEGDRVSTRKAIVGVLTGPLLGASPTNAPIRIDVIDIVRIRDGQIAEHWGVNTLHSLVDKLRGGVA